MKIDSGFLPIATTLKPGLVKPGPGMTLDEDGSIYAGSMALSMPYYFETTILSSQQPMTSFELATALSADSHYDVYLGKLMLDRNSYTLGTDFKTITFSSPLDGLGDVELVVSGVRSDYLFNLLAPQPATMYEIGAVKPGPTMSVDSYGAIDLNTDISVPIISNSTIRMKTLSLYDEDGYIWNMTLNRDGTFLLTKEV